MTIRLIAIFFMCSVALPQTLTARTPTPTIAIAGAMAHHHGQATSRGAAITTKIRANLAKAKLAGLTHLRIDTDRHGVVRLSGSVPDRATLSQVLAIAQGTEGVELVRNRLTAGH